MDDSVGIKMSKWPKCAFTAVVSVTDDIMVNINANWSFQGLGRHRSKLPSASVASGMAPYKLALSK